MVMDYIFEPITIEGNDYYSLKQFSFLVGMTESSIIRLVKNGNKLRKLKSEYFPKISHSPFIPISEYTEYIFTPQGRPAGASDLVGVCFNRDGSKRKIFKDNLGI